MRIVRILAQKSIEENIIQKEEEIYFYLCYNIPIWSAYRNGKKGEDK